LKGKSECLNEAGYLFIPYFTSSNVKKIEKKVKKEKKEKKRKKERKKQEWTVKMGQTIKIL
jgi:hypothetical protein